MTRPTGRPRGRPRKYPPPNALQPNEPILSSLTLPTYNEGDICPRCNMGYLVQRTGNFGPFLGCSEFPICRYSARVPKTPEPISGGTGTSNRTDPNNTDPSQQQSNAAGSGEGEPDNDPDNEPTDPSAAAEPTSEPSNKSSNKEHQQMNEPQQGQQQQQTAPEPFVPSSPLEQLVADIARKVASGLDIELAKAMEEAITAMLANMPATTGPTTPEPQLPANIGTIKLPKLKSGEKSDVALADRIAKRLKTGPVMLIGPSGCGKTHISEMVASRMGLRFGGISFSSGIGEGVLIGRLIPLAPEPLYLSAEFVDFFENGGVFLGDESDAADPSVTLILNQAIANGRLPLPHRYGKPYAMKHPDFHMICTMNTDGRGQNRNYSGRSAQDAAFLDRFILGFFRMDYDRELELRLCLENGGTEELARGIWAIRERAKALAYNDRGVITSTRAIVRGAQMMKQLEMSAAEVISEMLVRYSDDERAKLMQAGA